MTKKPNPFTAKVRGSQRSSHKSQRVDSQRLAKRGSKVTFTLVLTPQAKALLLSSPQTATARSRTGVGSVAGPLSVPMGRKETMTLRPFETSKIKSGELWRLEWKGSTGSQNVIEGVVTYAD